MTLSDFIQVLFHFCLFCSMQPIPTPHLLFPRLLAFLVLLCSSLHRCLFIECPSCSCHYAGRFMYSVEEDKQDLWPSWIAHWIAQTTGGWSSLVSLSNKGIKVRKVFGIRTSNHNDYVSYWVCFTLTTSGSFFFYFIIC